MLPHLSVTVLRAGQRGNKEQLEAEVVNSQIPEFLGFGLEIEVKQLEVSFCLILG